MARKAVGKKAKTVKGWSKLAPKTVNERRALLRRCGRKAFLDPDNLKYPIMAKSGPCVVNCKGLRAAKSRAGQQVSITTKKRKSSAPAKKLRAKAERIGKSAACHWAK